MSIESVPLTYEELRVRCWKLCFTDNALLTQLVRMGKQACLVKHYQFAESGFGGWADQRNEIPREAAPKCRCRNKDGAPGF